MTTRLLIFKLLFGPNHENELHWVNLTHQALREPASINSERFILVKVIYGHFTGWGNPCSVLGDFLNVALSKWCKNCSFCFFDEEGNKDCTHRSYNASYRHRKSQILDIRYKNWNNNGGGSCTKSPSYYDECEIGGCCPYLRGVEFTKPNA